MRLACAAAAALLVLTQSLVAQGAPPRAWQQRIEVELALPVPVVELASVNPFAIAVDQPPSLVASTPPKKLDVRGVAVVAAYVDPDGRCLGGVPLELPFPGLTQPILDELTATRFDPAVSSRGPVGSWVVLGIAIEGRVKNSTVGSPTFELPDPASPPEPAPPLQVAPSGLLLRVPFEPQGSITTMASPRRLRVKADAREVDVPVRALLHITAGGRCDRFVPLNLEPGLHSWLSAYLATWRLEPARRDGQPHEAWVVVSARARLDLSSLESTGVHVLRDRSFEPPAAGD